MSLTWKNVLNNKHNWHGSRDWFFEHIVIPSGYPYFLWNDRVYEVVGQDYRDTCLTINDIK